MNIWVLRILLFIGFILLQFLVSTIQNSHNPNVDRRYAEMISKLQHGDLIIINSHTFMSNLFKSVDQCDYASFKIVVHHGGGLKLLVSDLEDMSDTEGLYLSDFESFFSSYNDLELRAFRIKNFTPEMRLKIDRLIEQTKESPPYDFAFDSNDDSSMSCLKLIERAYGEDVMTKTHYNMWPYFSPALCDAKIEELFTPLTDWFPYWEP